MRGVCPECGCVGSVTVFISEAEGKETAAEITKRIDMRIARHIWEYLALFRTPGKSLNWKRARRLANEIIALTGSGYVQFDGKAARPAPPELWAEAMTMMSDRKNAGKLNLPLANHNYLRAAVYDMADRADRKKEYGKNKAEREGTLKREPEPDSKSELMSFSEYAKSVAAQGDLEQIGKLGVLKRMTGGLI